MQTEVLPPAQETRSVEVIEGWQQYAEEHHLRAAWGAGSSDPAKRQENMRLLLIGARGECAFCQGMRIPWEPKLGVVKGRPDVITDALPELGRKIQIRTRSLESVRLGQVDLCLRPDDPRDQAYVLVLTTGEHELQIIGWIWGHEGLRLGTRQNDGPKEGVFYIKHSYLRPIGDEPAEDYGTRPLWRRGEGGIWQPLNPAARWLIEQRSKKTAPRDDFRARSQFRLNQEGGGKDALNQ